MNHEQEWQDFVRQSASLLLSGRLTSQHLRNGVTNPSISALARRYDFGNCVRAACEQIQPTMVRNPSLPLELDAADRRFKQLVDSQQDPPTRNIA